jgi:hypothetical protein
MLQAEKLLPAIISDSNEHQYFLLYLELSLTSKEGTTMLTAPKSSTFPLNVFYCVTIFLESLQTRKSCKLFHTAV